MTTSRGRAVSARSGAEAQALAGTPVGPQVIVFLGGPGAGKGTQASRLAPVVGLPHVSSGDLLRDQASGGDPRMLEGNLLSDDVAAQAVFGRLAAADASRGALLDGFPRDLEQARALDHWLARRTGAVEAVVYLELPRSGMVQRVVERGSQSQRGDDTSEVVDRRADVFADELPSLLKHYQRRQIPVLHIDAALSIDEVHGRILAGLKGLHRL